MRHIHIAQQQLLPRPNTPHDMNRLPAQPLVPRKRRIRHTAMVEAGSMGKHARARTPLHAVCLEDGEQRGARRRARGVLLADALSVCGWDRGVDGTGPRGVGLAVRRVQREVERLLVWRQRRKGSRYLQGGVVRVGYAEERRVG